MSKDGSSAPKERVNIVYKPATGAATDEVELPLKVLMLGDYTGHASDVPLEDRKPINVDKNNFNDVMHNQDLHLTMDVADKLSGNADQRLAMDLKFSSLKDFEPEGIVNQVEPLQQLLQLRAALQALKGPMGNIPAFRKKIQALVGDAASRERLLQELGLDANPAGES
jgi:type VI secretion system protein ImpB